MFKYVCARSPIDSFYGTMTKQELLRSLDSRENYDLTQEDTLRHVEYLDSVINYINHYIVNRDHELPHTIRFFAIPVFEDFEMSLCAIAKTQNNGTTYLFTNVKDFYNIYCNSED